MSKPARPGPSGVPEPARAAAEPSMHRSGAVARMLRMPVATLRVWERRYGLSRPALSPSGQRLYSADDVRRLALLKQLTDLGHAIGSLAALNMAQLQGVAATHAAALTLTQRAPAAQAGAAEAPAPRPWRVAVVGAALAQRLQRPAVSRRLGASMVLQGVFDDLGQAGAALQTAEVDTLLVHVPQLQPGWRAAADALLPAGVRLAVLYGFAADAVCDELAAAGTALLRDPQPDAVLAQWLQALRAAAVALASGVDLPPAGGRTAPPRRWDDAALADFAGLSSTIACECPRHVAELLMQLSHFEDYSAQCQQRSRADAQIHAYLNHVAATARAQFEQALERVARHEGLLLPAARPEG